MQDKKFIEIYKFSRPLWEADVGLENLDFAPPRAARTALNDFREPFMTRVQILQYYSKQSLTLGGKQPKWKEESAMLAEERSEKENVSGVKTIRKR